MPLNEFDLINKYFKKKLFDTDHLKLGIGDDAAVFQAPAKEQIVITKDTLIAETHFFATDNPADIAYKAVAVNLSDLAAMGATPRYLLLGLTLPAVDENWLNQFSDGLNEISKKYQLDLIGGDTCRGDLAVSVTAIGFVPENQFITRANAKDGDYIFVSHQLGAAAYALDLIKNQQKPSDVLLKYLNRPEPEVFLGQQLRGIANSCIDISDGLLADLGHICESSNVGACLDLNAIPLLPELKKLPLSQALRYALTGGDDYALCFTVPKNKLTMLPSSCIKIGVIDKKIQGIFDENGLIQNYKNSGYRHF